MHYVTRRSHQMQKHKFYVTCLDALFVKYVPDQPKNEKECVDVLQLKRTGVHYVTRWST
jgi:hypothetical protein